MNDPLGSLHVAAAGAALISGGVVVLLPKGTVTHRRVGWLYVAAMATLNLTALLIYDLFGTFGPFHVAALMSGLTVLVGMAAARRRRPKRYWVVRHAWWMAGSYVGLWAAAISETTTRSFDLPFGPAVLGSTMVVAAVGGLLMATGVPRSLRRFGFGRP